MSYKTKKKDFDEFVKEAEYWIDYFGLLDWEFHFYHISTNGRAHYWADIQGRLASIELNTEWTFIPTLKDLQLSAFHEVCEIMIVPLSGMTSNVYDRNFVEGKTHTIIRRLENTIFKEHRG